MNAAPFVAPPRAGFAAPAPGSASPAVPAPPEVEAQRVPVSVAAIEPLSPAARRAVAVAMIALHAVVLWALLQMRTVREAVGEVAPIVVDFIVPPAPPKREAAPPPPPAPPEPVQAPPPQPAPPEPVQAPSPPKPVVTVKPKPAKPKPAYVAPPPPAPKPAPAVQAEPQPEPRPAPPAPVAESAPAEPAEPATPAAPPPPPAPKEMSIRSVSYLTPPVLNYPALSRRLQEQGRVDVRVLVDAQGLPRETQVARSSGYPRLDESALATARATRFVPYMQNGVPMPFWVVMPMIFELRN